MHSITIKRWAWCATMATATIIAAATMVPVMAVAGCGANESVLQCIPRKDGGEDGGEGGAALEELYCP